MGEVDLRPPGFHLRKVRELTTVIHSNGLKNLCEVVSVLVVKAAHGLHHSLAGLGRDAQRKVGFRLLLQQGKNNSLIPSTLSNHGVTLPVAFFNTQGGNLRTV